jgi:hypothetical protein
MFLELQALLLELQAFLLDLSRLANIGFARPLGLKSSEDTWKLKALSYNCCKTLSALGTNPSPKTFPVVRAIVQAP